MEREEWKELSLTISESEKAVIQYTAELEHAQAKIIWHERNIELLKWQLEESVLNGMTYGVDYIRARDLKVKQFFQMNGTIFRVRVITNTEIIFKSILDSHVGFKMRGNEIRIIGRKSQQFVYLPAPSEVLTREQGRPKKYNIEHRASRSKKYNDTKIKTPGSVGYSID